MNENEWKRVPLEHPRRCKGMLHGGGPCLNMAMEDSDYCPAHGGNKGAEAAEKKRIRNYRLAKFHARLEELGSSDEITSLKDEVAILRMLIEERINNCKDAHDLILVSGPLSDLILKVEKVVTSCHRLDSHLGQLLDKGKILQFAQVIIEIIGRYIDDEDIIENISSDILDALSKLK